MSNIPKKKIENDEPGVSGLIVSESEVLPAGEAEQVHPPNKVDKAMLEQKLAKIKNTKTVQANLLEWTRNMNPHFRFD